MQYLLVIFDLDGTILDTLEDLANATNFALNKNGFKSRSIEEIRMFVGNGLRKLVVRSLGENVSEAVKQKVLQDMTDFYKKNNCVFTKTYPGIIELFENLKKNNIYIAVNSNKPDGDVKTLCDKYFSGLVDFSVGAKDKNRLKPFSDGVEEIFDSIKIDKSNAVYIGDSDVDVQTAVNSGIDSISVCWGFRSKEFLMQNGAKKIVENISELNEILIDGAKK